MNKKVWSIGICVIVLTVLYIWSNSLPNIEQSNQQSGKVLKWIETVFRTPPLDTEENQHIIRKTAHMVEFGILGLEMAFLLFVTGAIRPRNIAVILGVGLAVAAADELIQVFTHRGAQISDVMLDFAGCLTGVGIVWAYGALAKRLRGGNGK